MAGRFYRTELLIGESALEKLRKSHVAVFGMGGVGSYAVEGLARAGIGALTIVDFDTIGTTNINRQIMALSSTVGKPKVEAMAERIRDINPGCAVQPIQAFFSREEIGRLLSAPYTVVVDAIDSFNPKVTLLVEALKLNFKVFSAMGAASKIDPSQIRVGDIAESTICPLARRLRKFLRRRGIEKGIPVVYSVEPPIEPFAPEEIPEDQREVTLKRGRPRMIQGSICHIPAIFGMTIAGMVINEITGLKTARITKLKAES